MKKNRRVMIAIVAVALSVTAVSFVIVKRVPQKVRELNKLSKSELLYKRAEEALKEGKKDDAITDFVLITNSYPNSESARKSFKNLGEFFETISDYQQARYYYERFLNDFPEVENIMDVKTALGNINIREMLSPEITDDSTRYEVQPGDSLFGIAKAFNTTVELIQKVNNLQSSLIRPGQKLKIIVSKFSISVDKSRNTLVLEKDGKVFKIYSVSTGKDNSTPVGEFKIEEKMVKPVWYKVGAAVSPESEEYELGSRWMGLSIEGYGIHGTSNESTIGSQITQGCVRMRNNDVIELFEIVPSGTEVRIN
ncbi:MAG: L,D-transpeptidase family protein [Candidatus Omnitrophota bacterium]